MPFPQRLIDGYRSFAANRLPAEQERYRKLADEGQTPESMIIACCDSRVSPATVFDAGPGELFVVRNVANLVPPYTPDGTYHGVSAALEFAVQVLGVRNVVVMGHARCGGVRAFAEQAKPLSEGNFIGKWMSLIEGAADEAGGRRADEPLDEYQARLEQASVVRSLANLKTFPFVAERVAKGSLSLHGAYFGIASGDLAIYDPAAGAFGAVTAR